MGVPARPSPHITAATIPTSRGSGWTRASEASNHSCTASSGGAWLRPGLAARRQSLPSASSR